MIVKRFLVVRADGEARVTKRPRLNADEVCFQLNIEIPDGWGKVIATPITVNLPDLPSASVRYRDQ